MRLMQSWSSDYSDLEHRRTKLFMEKIQPAVSSQYNDLVDETFERKVWSLNDHTGEYVFAFNSRFNTGFMCPLLFTNKYI